MVRTRSKDIVKKAVGAHTEAPRKHVGVQASGCRECQGLALAMEGSGDNACVRCEQVNDLLSLVVELKEEVERLRTIRECEREIDWWAHALREKEHVEASRTPEDPPPTSHLAVEGDLREEGEWKQVPARRSRQIPSLPFPPPQLPLQNLAGGTGCWRRGWYI
ncbi:death-associated protein 1 [Limosa lapponica baueri]|uniref:Death-associated protein 1 n=1 Tax=Limosa lapponica baueri TaxID=1758121 RepID=A0A2I0UP00_LIMLA|nr:death-associated protein 1 [Limosa lapponica baueri]